MGNNPPGSTAGEAQTAEKSKGLGAIGKVFNGKITAATKDTKATPEQQAPQDGKLI